MYKKEEIERAVKKLEELVNCKSKKDFSNLLGIKLKTIYYILLINKEPLYEEFTIPKKNGGVRNISAPNYHLKKIQKKLKKNLDMCYIAITHNNFNKRLAHGFIRKKSIITNSQYHKNKRYVLNIDLKDFFPSINFGRVRGFFIKNKYFQLNEDIATLIAQIACYNNQLPQGSPCSPIISNLLALSLDKYLFSLSKRYRFTYTRYADDITISTNLREFPEEIAYFDEDQNRWLLGNEIIEVINNNHFDINFDKIRMQYKTSRQEVTGLVTNKKVNIKRSYVRETRAMLDNLILYPNITDNYLFKKRVVEGRIAFINQIRKNNVEKNNRDFSLKMLEKFFCFDNFVNNNDITVLVEGITDKIYIKSAFRYFKSKYKFKLKIKTKTPFSKRSSLKNSGEGALNQLLSRFKEKKSYILNNVDILLKRSKMLKPKNPVIIIFDRDNKKFVDDFERDSSNMKYIFIEPNIYYFPIPELPDKKYLSIEYYFSDEVLNTPFKDHKLELNIQNKDKEIFYKIGEKGLSKNRFAIHIVRELPKTEFVNFKKIFDIIKEINIDYKSK